MKSETLTIASNLISAAIPDRAERAELLAMLAPKPPARDKMLTTAAACELAECHKKTLARWARRGYLHPRKITPSRVRWSRAELETFLAGGGAQAQA